MTNPEARLLFADSNVFIEDLFVADSAASVVIDMVAAGYYRLCTCVTVISDVERAILNKLSKAPNQLDLIIEDWQKLQQVVLSGNREHFNDKVAAKAGIPMLSCEEFIEIAAII